MKIIRCVLLFLFFCEYTEQRTQVEEELVRSLACVLHERCGACLAAATHCRWCSDPYYQANATAATVPRCNLEENLVNGGCSQYFIEAPSPSRLLVTADQPLADHRPDQLGSVQIQPQRISLTLRPQETRKVKFTYRPARNYPLDIYYLMDLTWSMKDDKETLVSLRNDLPVMLKNLTDNFRIGFGSFAEKPVLPFVYTDERRLANPCAGEGHTCQPTYSFRHHLSLTDQVNEFIEDVARSSVSANVDQAEAGLDALYQALVCGQVLAWSEVSRKIIIFLSDGYLHFAGDGKLGGALQRNDGECHLDADGYYAAATTFDYPSLAQIHRLLEEKKMNIIFGVTEDVKDHYDGLHKLLEDHTYIGLLEADSSNILKLVKKGYEDIISTVQFTDDSTDPVSLTYYSDCRGGRRTETRKCNGVEYGKTYEFEVEIKMKSCPDVTKRENRTVTIKETQLGQDTLTLELELLCGCAGCDEKDRRYTGACPSHSALSCGVCQCLGERSGPNCDCEVTDHAASVALHANCRPPELTRGPLCSGAGDCLCGRCYCDSGRYGKYCECKPCPINSENGLECGGAGRGGCGCGACACEAGWTGDSCGCTTRLEDCVAPGETEPCSGRGDCVCGKCQCAVRDGVRYAGAFCEACASCENAICARCEACVRCTALGNCTHECGVDGELLCDVTLDITNSSAEAGDSGSWCVARGDKDGMECEWSYRYEPRGRAVAAAVRGELCQQYAGARILSSGLLIMGFTVAAGLLVIGMIKSAQVVADRRAYAQFQKEAELSMLRSTQLNPIYVSPISRFTIPDAFPRDNTVL